MHRRVVAKLTFESYSAGEYIFHKGEIGDSMYLISHGEVGIILDEALSEVSLHH